MKKILLPLLLLTVMVSTVYSGLSWTNKSAKMRATAPVVANETLTLMPESDFVMIIDVGQILNSNKIVSMINSDPKASEEFRKFETEALKFGVDVHQLRQIAVGTRNIQDGAKANGYAIITGGFDREKILSSIAAHPDKVSVEAQDYNGKTLYLITEKGKNKGNSNAPVMGRNATIMGKATINFDKVGMSFLNPQTVVLGDLDGVKSTIDTSLGKRPGVMSNQQMAGYLSSTNPGAMLRFAGLLPEAGKSADKSGKGKVVTNEDLGANDNTAEKSQGTGSPIDGFSKMFESIRGTYGSIDFTSGVQLDTTLLIRSDNEAKQLSDSLNGLIMLGKGMLGGQAQQDPKQAKLLEAINRVNVAGNGRDVKITIDLSEQLLNELITILKSEDKKSSKKAAH